MYRKRHGRISPDQIVEFLLLDDEFPRAIHYCLRGARDSVYAITGTASGMFRNQVEQLLGELCSDLAYAHVDEIISAGLHEYLDSLQTKMNRVGDGIYEAFFAVRVAAPVVRPPRRRPVAAVPSVG